MEAKNLPGPYMWKLEKITDICVVLQKSCLKSRTLARVWL